MKVPAEKALSFTAVTVVCAVVLAIVVSVVVTPVALLFGGPSHFGAVDGSITGFNDTGKIGLPGGGTVDVNQMKAAADQMQQAATGASKKPPIAASALQTLLPGSIGGFTRTAVESQAIGALGSNAEGTYTGGGNSFSLKITDLAAMGAIAGLGSAMGVETSKQDADGYEKTGTVDGHLQSEEWHNAAHNGKFGVIVGNRFSIEAEGSATSIDDLKAAVAAIDQSRLAALGS
jgi:hypothetical protein